MTSMNRLGAIALISLASIAWANSAPAQSTPPDHWKLVPAPPTNCFAGDGFSEKVDAARIAIDVEIEAQRKVNEAARARFDAMDMMEKSRRMQAFMMKNPQAAMKMMQAEQAAGAAATAAITEASESSMRLEAELKRLQESFRGAAAQAVKPVLAKQKQLIDARTIAVGEAAISMFTTAADYAQYVQLIAEENAAYEQACAPFFGANGSFHKWASSYRTEVVDKLIGDNSGDAIMIMQMQAMDLPGGNYRSTTPLQQANEFARRLREAWAVRLNQAKPRVELKK